MLHPAVRFTSARLRARRGVALLLALVLLAAACGDDDGADLVDELLPDTSDVATSDADTTDDSDMSDDAAGDLGEDGTDPELDMTDSTDADLSGGDTTEPLGDDTAVLAAEFCALSLQASQEALGFMPNTATPAETEAFFRSQLALAQQGVDAAPDTMRAAIERRVQLIDDTLAVLESVGFSLRDAEDQMTLLAADPEWMAAVAQLETFDRDVCGVTPGSILDAPDEELPSTGPIADDPYCQLSAEISDRPGLPFDGTTDDVKAYYDQLITDLADVRALAPEPLQSAYATINDTFDRVYEIMEENGFDLDLAQPILDDFAGDPEVDGAMNAAIDVVEAYDGDVCGLT